MKNRYENNTNTVQQLTRFGKVVTFLFFALGLLLSTEISKAQDCTVSNGVGCLCPNGADNCDLLPDIVVSEALMMNPSDRVETRGELRISIGTPNLGHGPLEVRTTNFFICGTDTCELFPLLGAEYYVCGTDTTFDAEEFPTFCANGNPAKQLIEQRIYQKQGDTITYYQRTANAMTHHPDHGHMHVDDWCDISLRIYEEGTHPSTWQVVAQGDKLGFCLMNSDSCNPEDEDYDGGGFCVNEFQTAIESETLLNHGLGDEVGYGCGKVKQGISVGHSDVYSWHLPDMEVLLPDTVCNNDYYFVVHVDPLDIFVETNEDNNWTAVPITLEKQDLRSDEILTVSEETTFCEGETLPLSPQYGEVLTWSNGDTGSSIEVTASGDYTVLVETVCGEIQSDPVAITVLSANPEPVQPDPICKPESVVLEAIGNLTGTTTWTDENGAVVATGNSFTTPEMEETTTYWVEGMATFTSEPDFGTPHDNTFGTGGYSLVEAYMIFDVFTPVTLKSVLVYSNQGTEDAVIYLRKTESEILDSVVVDIPQGESRLTLNFDLPADTSLQLATSAFKDLYRMKTSVVYPYGVEGKISIKASSLDVPAVNSYKYYYFFDWELQTPSYVCESEPEAVTIVFDNCVGIDEAITNDLEIALFPNPSRDNIQFRLPENAKNQAIEAQLLNSNGQLVLQQILPPQLTQQITIQHLPNGIYWLRLTTEKGETAAWAKVLKG